MPANQPGEDRRPWDALSRARPDLYAYTLYCAGQRPRCGHAAPVDPAALIARAGDRTWDWVRAHARCAACGRRGASLIVAPRWTGPGFGPTRNPPGLDTPPPSAEHAGMRIEILELYPFACCRPPAAHGSGGVWLLHLDDADPEPFAQGETEDAAWAEAWRRLQNLPDD